MPHTWDAVSTRAGDIYPAEEIAAATPEPKYGINVPDAPPCAQAASLAGMLLRATRQPTWPALARAVADGDEDTLVRLADYRLTEEQQTLLDDWAAVIEVAVAEPGGTVCVCSGCGDWSAIGSRSVPSSCRTTAGCTGTVTRAPRATRGPVTPTHAARPRMPDRTRRPTTTWRLSSPCSAPHLGHRRHPAQPRPRQPRPRQHRPAQLRSR